MRIDISEVSTPNESRRELFKVAGQSRPASSRGRIRYGTSRGHVWRAGLFLLASTASLDDIAKASTGPK